MARARLYCVASHLRVVDLDLEPQPTDALDAFPSVAHVKLGEERLVSDNVESVGSERRVVEAQFPVAVVYTKCLKILNSVTVAPRKKGLCF